MTPEQFCYWLQGKMEGRDISTINHTELVVIRDHLKTVFNKVTPNTVFDLTKLNVTC